MVELLILIVLVTASCLFGREAVRMVEDIYRMARERIRPPEEEKKVVGEESVAEKKEVSG